jgi:2-aminoethylphosphonate transport system permease protein
VLVENRAARRTVQLLAILVVLGVFVIPFGTILLGSFATAWSSIFPAGLTPEHYAAIFTDPETSVTIVASIVTAASATAIALVTGTTTALATRFHPRLRAITDGLLLLPSAIPSVAIGLSVLMAFSRPPFLWNGSPWIVILAHSILITAAAYQPVSAAVRRLDPGCEEAAAVLGSHPARILTRVTLPRLKPALLSAASLAVALSMGELTATLMVAPAGWRTMPMQIFSLTSRGIRLYDGAALAVVLMAITLVVLLVMRRLARRTADLS